MTTRLLVAAAVAVGAAAAYALSPLTALAALTVAWIVHRGIRGLDGRERRLILGLLVAAALLRGLAILAVLAATDPWREPFLAIFGDARFTIERALWVRSSVLGEEIGPWYRLAVFDPYGGNVFYYYLAFLQVLFGPAPYAITLVSVTSFMGGAVIMYRAARTAYGSIVAGIGLAVLLFWPTFFVWSVTMLKESVLLLLTAVVIASVWWLSRSRGVWPRLRLIAACAVALAVLTTMRDAALALIAGGVGLGLTAYLASRRAAGFVVTAAAIVVVLVAAARMPVVQAAVRTQVVDSIGRHVGHWASNGVSYRIADTRFYTDGQEARFTMTAIEGARFLGRAAAAFILVPLPSHVVTATAWAYLPVHFLWLTLIGFALAGAWIGFRQDALMTALLAGYCVAAVAVIAPNSGNVGTLIRHRDAILPFAVWLSAAGLQALLGPRKGSACA